MTPFADIASLTQTSAPWLWLAGSLAAYLAFLVFNPVGHCFVAGVRLLRLRPILVLLPALFALSAALYAMAFEEPVAAAAGELDLRAVAVEALRSAWQEFPFFLHILVPPFPLSLLAALLFFGNVGGVLVTFARSEAWTGRVAWVAGFGLVAISGLVHLAVGGAQLFQVEIEPPVVLVAISQGFVLLTGMFVQAYLMATVIITSVSPRKGKRGTANRSGSALIRAAECFPRVVPLVSLYLVVWGLATYGGSSQAGFFVSQFIVPEIMLVLAFLPVSALVVRGGFTAVGGVTLMALARCWWVWLWSLAAIFATLFMLRFSGETFDILLPWKSVGGTIWRIVYPFLWAVFAAWMLSAWVTAFRAVVIPAMGLKSKQKRRKGR